MLSKKLREARKRLGLTQQQLAKAAGVSQQLITKLETGSAMETRKLHQIAKALQTSVDDLMGEDGVRESTAPYYGIQLTRAGAMLAAEWEQLSLADRIDAEEYILARRARTHRDRPAERPRVPKDKP